MSSRPRSVGWLRNSAVYSALTLVITLVTSIPAGYAPALTNFRGRKTLLAVTLVVMIMPSVSLVLPVFLELNEFGLIGTIWSVVLPLSFYSFGVYLVYIYFATSLPREIIEAARIDGCTQPQVFTKVALPLARPVAGLVVQRRKDHECSRLRADPGDCRRAAACSLRRAA